MFCITGEGTGIQPIVIKLKNSNFNFAAIWYIDCNTFGGNFLFRRVRGIIKFWSLQEREVNPLTGGAMKTVMTYREAPPCGRGASVRPFVMRESMKDRKGFSLIELMIVIALMGTIAAIGSFAWNKYTMNANLRAATRDIASDFFVTREKAASENRNYRITLNPALNNYTIQQGTAAGGPYAVVNTKALTSYSSDIVLQNANFGLGGNTAGFQPRGIVAAGTVTLGNGRGSTATITVNITGRTYVQFAMQ